MFQNTLNSTFVPLRLCSVKSSGPDTCRVWTTHIVKEVEFVDPRHYLCNGSTSDIDMTHHTDLNQPTECSLEVQWILSETPCIINLLNLGLYKSRICNSIGEHLLINCNIFILTYIHILLVMDKQTNTLLRLPIPRQSTLDGLSVTLLPLTLMKQNIILVTK